MITYDDIEQRSPEWFFKRGGTITGTRLKGIMGTLAKRKDVEYEILAEKLAIGIGEEDNRTAMEKGVEYEPVAIAEFELEHGVKVRSTGFAENEKNCKIANSPDGIVEDTDEAEMVEVKCPERKNFVKYVIENVIPEEYNWQVVQYFTVNEKLNKLWFVIYNPSITCHPMHVITVYRKDVKELIDRAIKTQTVVLQEVEAMYATFPGVEESFNNL